MIVSDLKYYIGEQEVNKIVFQGIETFSSESSAWSVGIQTTPENDTFSVNIAFGTSPNITIDWGDGTVENFTDIGVKTKTYASAGFYTVKISGSFASDGNIRLGNTTAERASVQSTSVIPTIPGLTRFNNTFFNCTSLTTVPAKVFANNTDITIFTSVFQNCTSLTSIPAGLFANNINATSFSTAFRGCTSLTSIPAGLFANNINVTNFGSLFHDCINLTSIPSGLFDNNTAVTTFTSTFNNCTSLTTVPAGLFANNTAVSFFNSIFLGVTLTTESYSNLLINMASNAASRSNSIFFHGGNSKYNTDGETARSVLVAKFWTFTDGGLET